MTKNRNSCKIRLIVNIFTIFRKKCLTFIAFSFIINANVVMCAKKTRHRETEIRKLCLTRNDTVNQRIIYVIANQVAIDLPGHREMHVRRASLSVVAPSRVPVCLDVQWGGPPYIHGR